MISPFRTRLDRNQINGRLRRLSCANITSALRISPPGAVLLRCRKDATELSWRTEIRYAAQGDHVFASPKNEGKATALDVSHYAASHQTGSRRFGHPVGNWHSL